MNNQSSLADRYADIKAQIEFLEGQLSEVKKEIKEIGQEKIVGETAIVELSLSERVSLDQKMVKELMSDEDIKLCQKTTLVETIRVKRISK